MTDTNSREESVQEFAIVRGRPNAEELAAVLAVLHAATADPTEVVPAKVTRSAVVTPLSRRHYQPAGTWRAA